LLVPPLSQLQCSFPRLDRIAGNYLCDSRYSSNGLFQKPLSVRTKAATRFAISHPAVGTILVGMATPQQFEDALVAVQKGRLPSAALDQLARLQQTFAGELR